MKTKPSNQSLRMHRIPSGPKAHQGRQLQEYRQGQGYELPAEEPTASWWEATSAATRQYMARIASALLPIELNRWAKMIAAMSPSTQRVLLGELNGRMNTCTSYASYRLQHFGNDEVTA
jgi:hypothetical protein